MKATIILLLIIVGSVTTIFAQKAKNEFGLLLYNNDLLLFQTPQEIQHYFVNGIQYKRSLNEKYMMRLTTQFSDQIKDYVEIDYYSVARSRQFNNSIGIEKIFSQGKIRPFAFVDLFYRYLEEETHTVDNNTGNWPFSFSGKRSSFQHFAGTSLGFGIKYFPTERIFINVEMAYTVSRNIFDGALTPKYYYNLNIVRALTVGVNF